MSFPNPIFVAKTPEDFENTEGEDLRLFSLRIQLAAAAMASSFLLISLPNIETITFTVFVFGFLFPIRYSLSLTLTIAIGWEILISTVLSFSGITFFFKLFAWILITLLGQFARELKAVKTYHFAIFGLLSALIFDFIVTIAVAILFFNNQESFIAAFFTFLVIGILFTIAHIIGNVILFTFIPRFVGVILPLLNQSYPTLVKIKDSYFTQKPRHLFIYFTALTLSLLILTSGLLSYSSLTEPDESGIQVSITLQIDYNDVKPFEEYHLMVFSNQTLFEITQTKADLQVRFFLDQPYIEGINGVVEDEDLKSYYWIIYENGNESGLGAGIIYPEENDLFLWVYES